MSKTTTVKAEARQKVGKGAARHLRRNGMIPAIIYGAKQDPLPIAVPYKETYQQLTAGGFMTTIAEIEVDGKTIKALPKTYELDPVRDFLIHVDFLRVSERTRVTVNVPVHFEGEEECPGLKEGGVLNIVRHDVEVEAPAGSIPDSFTLALEGYQLGDSIHASALKLPKGVELTITDRDFTIATIAAPAALLSEESEEGEGAEDGEVEQTEVTEQNAQTVEGETKANDE